MKFYMTTASLTGKAVRLYLNPPEWDGFEHQGVYQTIGKDTLVAAGIREFPAPNSNTVMIIELKATALSFHINGDTEVKKHG